MDVTPQQRSPELEPLREHLRRPRDCRRLRAQARSTPGLATFLPTSSGWAWGLSIVFLTITVRIVLFPLFVKQIKSQRRMQEIAPKIKELQAKHKGDRETLNVELMKLYKEHGTNPISGCLPLLLQLPIFFALFRVMNEFKPHFKLTASRSHGQVRPVRAT